VTASSHAARAESRATHRERRTSQAISIVERDATLRTAFLLESIACPEEDPFTDDRASRFLLWFALEGRHHYRQASFSPAYLDFLSVPVSPYRSRLAAFVALNGIIAMARLRSVSRPSCPCGSGSRIPTRRMVTCQAPPTTGGCCPESTS
jgi:hypothetical protein